MKITLDLGLGPGLETNYDAQNPMDIESVGEEAAPHDHYLAIDEEETLMVRDRGKVQNWEDVIGGMMIYHPCPQSQMLTENNEMGKRTSAD